MDQSTGRIIVIANFTSRHFEFTAAGLTNAQAKEALIAGLKAHDSQYPGLAGLWSQDDFNLVEVPLGGCLRDTTLLTSGASCVE